MYNYKTLIRYCNSYCDGKQRIDGDDDDDDAADYCCFVVVVVEDDEDDEKEMLGHQRYFD